ncbi:ladderlectin-like [Mya arenaria]|uniref:ladderlectin-like n=1 Tax=Mya arenaria TaxID=6604 RepID=UPI0022E6588C|nr:ladderlectin-like [Mya arenaria]
MILNSIGNVWAFLLCFASCEVLTTHFSKADVSISGTLVEEQQKRSSLDCMRHCFKQKESCDAARFDKGSKVCQLISLLGNQTQWLPSDGVWKINKVPTGPTCDVGWVSSGYACFLVVTSPMTLDAARNNCESFGAKLASISDANENQFVIDLLTAESVYEYVWIGGSDVLYEGTWAWDDGEAFDFDFFLPGQPDGGTQNYMVIDGSSYYSYYSSYYQQFGWRDLGATGSYMSLCKSG